jgi:wyosine [tRNA(Phe)-imidazoG37] synthetase (radical SAM superfamily)
MLTLSMAEVEEYTKPLCSESLYDIKVENYQKVEASFAARAEHCDGLPIQIHLESSGRCNLLCPICPRGRGLVERNQDLSFETFERVFIPLSETLANIVISGFGEPLLNPETSKMVELATRHGVSTCMNSNGTFLEKRAEEILDAQLTLIKVALDGAMSTSCHLYNAEFPFETVIAGLEALHRKKEEGGYDYPIIVGQFVVSEGTVNEMGRLEEWARGIGVERVSFKRLHHTMPGERERQRLFSEHDFTRILAGNNVNTSEKLTWSQSDCSHPWDSFFLSCTGEIGLCSFDPYLVIKLDPGESNFVTMWNCERLARVRRWHSPGRTEIAEPCSKCNRLPGYLWVEENSDKPVVEPGFKDETLPSAQVPSHGSRV